MNKQKYFNIRKHLIFKSKNYLGCYQDHRQDQAGRCEPGQGVQGGGRDEVVEPPEHCQAVPSDGDQEHALPGLRICSTRRNIWYDPTQ